jgi:hypothetical protein
MPDNADVVIQRGAFISHIAAESPIALVLQDYLQKAYTVDFPVFVSSDKKSIPGGEGWWQHIRSSIKERQIILVLLSDESSSQEWINFEAGVGDGSGAKVIPIAIKNYRFDKLDFPLKGFQGRYVADWEGILYDIETWANAVAASVDKAAYLSAIKEAEESVTYKKLLFRPVRTTFGATPCLMFELENRGNVDIDLLFAEVNVPQHIIRPSTSFPDAPPTVELDRAGDRLLIRYYTVPNNIRKDLRRLEPTITRSMGVRRLRDLRLPLVGEEEGLDLASVVRFQIHGRDIDTEPDEMLLGDVPVEPQKCS